MRLAEIICTLYGSFICELCSYAAHRPRTHLEYSCQCGLYYCTSPAPRGHTWFVNRLRYLQTYSVTSSTFAYRTHQAVHSNDNAFAWLFELPMDWNNNEIKLKWNSSQPACSTLTIRAARLLCRLAYAWPSNRVSDAGANKFASILSPICSIWSEQSYTVVGSSLSNFCKLVTLLHSHPLISRSEQFFATV